MKRYIVALLAVVALLPLKVNAEQSQTFGDYVVHYNAFTTDMLQPKMAKLYNIKRSKNRALLNISVLKKLLGTPSESVKALVKGSATNLVAQYRPLELREVKTESGAIYYLAEINVDHKETIDFTIQVTPEGLSSPLELKFRQQFFTQ